MLSLKSVLVAVAMATAAMSSQATSIQLNADGQWNAFGVDSISSLSGDTEWIDNDYTNAAGYGSALNFTFTINAGYVGQLTVVDASLAGDTFNVFNNGTLLGTTSSVAIQNYANAPDVGYDYDAALLNSAFSHGVFTLSAGTYSISGNLMQSLMIDDGSGNLSALNATAGAIKLSVSAVPEPSTWLLLVAALGVMSLTSRRSKSH
jgi:hypothetical protein